MSTSASLTSWMVEALAAVAFELRKADDRRAAAILRQIMEIDRKIIQGKP